MKNKEKDFPYWEKGMLLLGLDEAGRGPIAGPLVVAGCILPVGYECEELDDSKKLSEKKRKKLFHKIREDALWYQILFVDEKTIDEKNIYAATQQAMSQIADNAKCDYIISDAMPLLTKKPFEAQVKADANFLSVAAASILAKVSRDEYMMQLDKMYPCYGFKNHKGYPTKAHLAAIEQYGVNEHFRASYAPVSRILHKNEQLRLF